MSIQERRVINQVEILNSGDIQVREHDQILINGNWVQIGLPHRKVIASDEVTPSDVQAFLDNSKA